MESASKYFPEFFVFLGVQEWNFPCMGNQIFIQRLEYVLCKIL